MAGMEDSSSSAARALGPCNNREMAVAVTLVSSPACVQAGYDAANLLNSGSGNFWLSPDFVESPTFVFQAHQSCVLVRFEWRNPHHDARCLAKRMSLEAEVGASWQELSVWDAPATVGWQSHVVRMPYQSQKWRVTLLAHNGHPHGQFALQAALFVAEVNVCRVGAMLWSDVDFTDVAVVVGERRFRAHRAVLAAASPVFSAMLRSGMQEEKAGEIQLQDAEAGAVEDLLEYIYTGRMPGHEPFGALLLGHKYEIEGLVKRAAPLALQALTAENVAAVLCALRPYAGDAQLGPLWESLRDEIHKNKDLLTAALLDLAWMRNTRARTG